MFNQISFNLSPFNRVEETEIVPQGIAIAQAVTRPVDAITGPGPLPTRASGKAVVRAVCIASRLYRTIYKTLDLSEITIPAGAEIAIDTENMTLTIDGVNAIFALTDESRFFNLAKGDTLEIEGSGQATITLQWKDRWL